MWIGSQGDPSLGNTFRVHLKAAPTGAVAWRFGRVGACGNGIQLPFPLGGRMYGDPGQILFPFLNLQGLANGDGQAAWDLPVPNTTSVCGLKLCLQWYFACRGATGAAGMGMSRGFEFSIVGG